MINIISIIIALFMVKKSKPPQILIRAMPKYFFSKFDSELGGRE